MAEELDTSLPASVIAPWGTPAPIPQAPPAPAEEPMLEGVALAGGALSVPAAHEALAVEEIAPAPPEEPVASPIPQAPPAAPLVQSEEPVIDGEMVTVTVPRSFNLRMDTHAERKISVGIQEMRRDEAEHWYSKANGVKIYRG